VQIFDDKIVYSVYWVSHYKCC